MMNKNVVRQMLWESDRHLKTGLFSMKNVNIQNVQGNVTIIENHIHIHLNKDDAFKKQPVEETVVKAIDKSEVPIRERLVKVISAFWWWVKKLWMAIPIVSEFFTKNPS